MADNQVLKFLYALWVIINRINGYKRKRDSSIKEGLFEYEYDLDEYIETIYDNIEEYQKGIFDPNDPTI